MLSVERLREVLSYDPDTGEFVRLVSKYPALIGRIAGSSSGKGYLTIMVDGVLYQAHRLAWLYVHGMWPTHGIDHCNEDKTDNRIRNLRDATASQNMHNQTKPQQNNRSGYRGVCWHKRTRKFQAQIGVGGKVRHLGYFTTAAEASEAYQKAKSLL